MTTDHSSSNPSTEAHAVPQAAPGGGHRLVIVAGVLLGMLLAAIDQTIVATAMPRMLADLGGMQHYAWVFTSYMLASTVTVPIYGKLSDLYGRRPFYLGGMLLFLLGSALSGLSQDMTQLIFFRGLQGLGAGALLPIAQAILGDLFPPAERGKWQGLLMAVFGLAIITGPVAGGWIAESWGWRWVFYVNLPVGVVALLTAGLALPGQPRQRQAQLDYLGAASLSAGSISLLLACSWAGTRYAWTAAPILGLLALALVMLGAFVIVELRAAEPMIAPSLFHNRVFAISVVVTLLMHSGMFAVIMFLPLFVQGVHGVSATSSGGVITPLLLAYIISSAIGGQIMARTGRYKALALAGIAIALAGMLLLVRLPAAGGTAQLVRAMVIIGLGMGVSSSLLVVVVQNAFPSSQLGQVTGSWQFFRTLGGTVGVAVLGSLMTQRFTASLQASLSAAARETLLGRQPQALLSPQALFSPAATAQLRQPFAGLGPQGQALFEQAMAAMRLSLGTALGSVFTAGAVMLAAAFLVTIFMPELPLRRAHSGTPPAELSQPETERP